ncbi:hypothetical protein M3J09_001318 [Ascochyta lentis]
MQSSLGCSHGSLSLVLFSGQYFTFPSILEGKSSTAVLPTLKLNLIPDPEETPPRSACRFVMSIELGYRADIEGRPAILDIAFMARLGKVDAAYARARAKVPIRVTPLATSTGDPQRLQTVEKWLADCQRSHPRCIFATNNCSYDNLPSRLIDVSNPYSPRLVIKHEITNQAVRYTTLSHRWRPESMPKLLKANLEIFRKLIDPHILPPVFLDSVTLCHQLGINYLWIDALCLIQDDPIDRGHEIERMGTIYYHAFCNFSAKAAAERPVGLFVHSHPLSHTAFPLSAERENQRFELYGYPLTSLSDTDNTTLKRRGWVLQERLLSARTIFFGDQLSWECMEFRANETFVEGRPGFTPGHGRTITSKLDNLRGRWDLNSGGVDRPKDPDKPMIYRQWRGVVSRYNRCDLTFDGDIFPALSGLARRFNEELQDRYLAGLWEGDLYSNIIWSRSHKPYVKLGSTKPKMMAYRAPSWSWASIRGPSDPFFEPYYDGTPKRLAKILGSSVTLAGDDPYGQVLDGHIQLQGALKAAQHRKSTRSLDQPFTHGGDGEWYDDGYDDDHSRWTTGALFFPMLYYNVYEHRDRKWPAIIVGLILEEVVGRDSTYRRVGLFVHRHGELCDREIQEEWYPELADFDPDNYECQDITII